MKGSFLFSIFTESSASINERIVENLKMINNVSFDFEQNINGKIENGNCIIEYPKKIYCKYNLSNQKVLVANGKSLVIKTLSSYYFYPLEKTPLNTILNKDYLLKKIANLDQRDLDKENILQYLTPRDIRSFGLIPEIIGRLPVITHMNPLDEASLRMILTTPKNALIKQYIQLFEMDDIELQFTPGALDFIVEKALQYKLGARGLRSLCEAILNDAMFEMPNTEVKNLKITKQYADQKLSKIELPKLKVVS